jgi:cytochrome c biogenesis protein CcmG, thiol:disulfide interchange protein DsbE
MNIRRVVIAVAGTIPLVALLAWGMGHDPRAIPSPLPGREAPEFALSVFRLPDSVTGPANMRSGLQVGDTVRLAGHRDEVVVLNFWASWCLACRDEHTVLSEAASQYAAEPVRFYGVLYNDSPENGIRWIQGMGGQRYPALTDPGSRTAIDYGLYGVPETFFIGRDGRVAYKHVGPVTPAVLREHIDRLKSAPIASVTP